MTVAFLLVPRQKITKPAFPIPFIFDLSELMAAENFDQILIYYSIGNFLTDTNWVWIY